MLCLHHEFGINGHNLPAWQPKPILQAGAATGHPLLDGIQRLPLRHPVNTHTQYARAPEWHRLHLYGHPSYHMHFTSA